MGNTLARVLSYYFPNGKSTIEHYNSFWHELLDQMLVDKVAPPQDGYGLYFSVANLTPARMPGQELFAQKSFFWEPTLSNITLNPYRCHTYAPHAQKGDLTCMFIGAAEPYLLRKQGRHYVIVGDASFGPFSKPLWRDCEIEYEAGQLAIETFELR
jgi:hypothetical protein